MATIKNKIYAILLFVLGLISLAISSDATFFIVLTCLSVPMFFAKENWIYEG